MLGGGDVAMIAPGAVHSAVAQACVAGGGGPPAAASSNGGLAGTVPGGDRPPASAVLRPSADEF